MWCNSRRLLGVLVFAALMSGPVSAQQAPVLGNLVPCTNCFVPAPILAATGAASNIQQTSADVAGTCDPNGQEIGGKHGLSPDPTFVDGNDTYSTGVLLGSGVDPVAVTGGSFSGLTCNTLYYFATICYRTEDQTSLSIGDVASFTTAACTPPAPTPPTVSTAAATQVTHEGAQMHGTVDPEGLSATGQFLCGTLAGIYNGCGNIASPTTAVGVGAGSSPVAISTGLTGLVASTTYYFRARGTNAGGVTDAPTEQNFTTTPAPGGTQRLLTAADYTYLGSKRLAITGTVNHMCLAVRYRMGTRYLMTLVRDVAREVNDSAVAYNGTISSVTRTWNIGGALMDILGCYWDETEGRLVTSSGIPYSTPNATNIYQRDLADNQTVSNIQGPYLLTGLSQKNVYGGCIPTPPDVVSAWGVGAWTCGWGGQSSTLTAAGGTCVGLCVFFMPDPDTLTPNVGTTNWTTGARHAFNASESCALTSCNRGRRVTAYSEYLNNDPRNNAIGNAQMTVNVSGTTVTRTGGSGSGSFFPFNNPSTTVLAPSWWIGNGYTVRINGTNVGVSAMASTTSMTIGTNLGSLTGVPLVGPDHRPLYAPITTHWSNVQGFIPFGPYDDYGATCVWIWTTARRGLPCFFKGAKGKSWYGSSDVHRDGNVTELHIYEPMHLKEVVDGVRDKSQVQPFEMNTSLVAIPNARLGNFRVTAYPRRYGISSAVYDPTAKEIIAMGCRLDAVSTQCELYYWSVSVD